VNGEPYTFGFGALAFIGLYLMSMLGIGWLGYRARRQESLSDFFLAGRRVGFLVLVLTLYATQYSGNTLFGFTGTAFKRGYFWITSLHFMTAIVVFYLLFAPRLYALSKRRGFITPSDYLFDRFRSPALVLVGTTVMVVAVSNYLVAQLKAMGHAVEGLTNLDPQWAYGFGVVALAMIIIVYENLGGFRAVAWTDTVQGLILIFGFAALVFMVWREFGSVADATQKLASRSEQVSKVKPPDAARCREWLSYILLVGIGGALYPQAIQRIYAARSAATLRRSLAVMAFLPLTTTVVAIVVGIIAAAHLTGPMVERPDRVLAVMCQQVQQNSQFGYWLVVLIVAAILAAMMSTADSVLLSISSMLTKDIYVRFIHPGGDEQLATRLAKHLSWVVLAIATGVAILLRERTDLVRLLDRKFDLLVQLAPAFMIGVRWSTLRAGPVLLGVLVGISVSLLIAYAMGKSRLWGFHPGLYGLAANTLIAVGGSMRPLRVRNPSGPSLHHVRQRVV